MKGQNEKIKEVAAGAFFVPTYSEQTVLTFQPVIDNQTILMSAYEETESPEQSEENSDKETRSDSVHGQS